MNRITLISDNHIPSPDIESMSLFPPYMKRHPKRYAELANELQSYHDQSIEHLRKTGPHELLIHFGDLTSGWMESGIVHPDLVTAAADALRAYKNMSEVFHICWGNHDTGYKEVYGDMTMQSLRACQSLSPLWWAENVGGLLLIGLTSPLAQYEGEDPEILALQREQNGFIYETLRAAEGARWMICSHQRKVLPYIESTVKEFKKSFAGLIHGDEHNPTLSKFLDIIHPIPRKFRDKTIIACPSISPIWWKGAGYLSGFVENGKLMTLPKDFFVIKKRKPMFSSPLKCLYWCWQNKR